MTGCFGNVNDQNAREKMADFAGLISTPFFRMLTRDPQIATLSERMELGPIK
jgi:hypothetical protein